MIEIWNREYLKIPNILILPYDKDKFDEKLALECFQKLNKNLLLKEEEINLNLENNIINLEKHADNKLNKMPLEKLPFNMLGQLIYFKNNNFLGKFCCENLDDNIQETLLLEILNFLNKRKEKKLITKNKFWIQKDKIYEFCNFICIKNLKIDTYLKIKQNVFEKIKSENKKLVSKHIKNEIKYFMTEYYRSYFKIDEMWKEIKYLKEKLDKKD
jgi:hypothetical protein